MQPVSGSQSGEGLLGEAYEAARSAILQSTRDATDEIHQCGSGAVRLLALIARDDRLKHTGSEPIVHRLDDILRLAYDKLQTYPFKEVPLCWRRLYVDASILKAIHTNEPESLDLAIILAGAPRRRELVEEIFRAMEHRPTQCQKVEFPASSTPRPTLRFPIQRTDILANYPMPMIVTNNLDHWPALAKWKTPSYLLQKTLDGRRLVPVETGRSYTDEGWGQSIISFRDFLNRYVLSDQIAYLAQHDLFAQIPSLRMDIAIPDCCYTSTGLEFGGIGVPCGSRPQNEDSDDDIEVEDPLINAWFGPAGTVSPLHTDPYHNVLCQVVGQKYVRLYSPKETPKLYPRGIEEGGVDMSNTSQVDVEDDQQYGNQGKNEDGRNSQGGSGTEVGRFPLFKDAEYVEGILEEGECLYIPVS